MSNIETIVTTSIESVQFRNIHRYFNPWLTVGFAVVFTDTIRRYSLPEEAKMTAVKVALKEIYKRD